MPASRNWGWSASMLNSIICCAHQRLQKFRASSRYADWFRRCWFRTDRRRFCFCSVRTRVRRPSDYLLIHLYILLFHGGIAECAWDHHLALAILSLGFVFFIGRDRTVRAVRDRWSSPSAAGSAVLRHEVEFSNTLMARRRDPYSVLPRLPMTATWAKRK